MNARSIFAALTLAALIVPGAAIAANVNFPAGATLTATLQNEINTKTAQDKLNFDTIQFDDGTRAQLAAELAGIDQKKQTNYLQAAGQALGGMIAGNIVGKAVGTNVGGLIGLAGGALLAANTSYNIDIPAGATARITLTAPLVAGHPQSR
jgi:hypothetical protein